VFIASVLTDNYL